MNSGHQVGSQPYTYAGTEYIFSGTTTSNMVTITGGAEIVYLNGVNIDVSNVAECSFDINTGSDLTLVLNEGTTNTLTSGSNYAGLQKSQTGGMLTISGTGTLNATGGSLSAISSGPGIGNKSGSDFSNLTIESGIINASTVSSYANGIGAGYEGLTSNIYIKGGTISSSINGKGCCLGSLSDNNENIVISGGFLNLTGGGNSSFASNYLLPTNTTITGGTITGYINYTSDYNYNKLFNSGTVITGGSVNLLDYDEGVTISDDDRPTNGAETALCLYRSQYKIPGVTAATQVTSVVVNDETSWGCDEVYTDENGIMYLWLPQDDASAYETTKVAITVNDVTYTYNGQIDATDELIEETEDVTAFGNYFYQVPVSISTEHATVAVQDYDGNSIIDGSYISSGLLDDNKVRFTINATAEDGYGEPVITLENAEEGTTYYKVTAEDDETLNISVSASVVTGMDNQVLEAIWVNTSGKNIVINNAIGCQISIYNISGKEVYKGKATSNAASCAINQSGLYIVKVSGDILSQARNFKCVIL